MASSSFSFVNAPHIHQFRRSPPRHHSRTTFCPLAPDLNVKAASSSPKATAQQPKPKLVKALPLELRPDERPPLPPVHHSIPVIGFFVEQALGLFRNRFDRLGPVFSSNFLIRNFTYVGDYDAVVDILRDSKLFTNKGSSPVLPRIFGSDSMIVLDPPQHTNVRRIVASAFSPVVFPFYFDSIVARVNRTWENVMRECVANGSVKMDPVFRSHYLAITIELTTGIDMESEISGDIRDKFRDLQNSLFSPPFGPIWEKGQKAKRELVVILRGAVLSKLRDSTDTIGSLREYGENLSYQANKDIITGDVDVLLIAIACSDLKTGTTSNDLEVIDSLCNLMLLIWFAGYATSAATSSCALFELGWDKSIVAQLTKEQEDLISAAAGDRAVTYDQTNTQMPLLDSYITEIMRLHPAASGLSRRAAADAEVMGRYVKKDTTVLVSLANAMRDERFYPQPNTLKVDRFVPKKGEPPATKILSFGGPGSPHYCLGGALSKVLMKTTFAVLLRNYSIELNPTQSREYYSIPEQVPKSRVVIDEFSRRILP